LSAQERHCCSSRKFLAIWRACNKIVEELYGRCATEIQKRECGNGGGEKGFNGDNTIWEETLV